MQGLVSLPLITEEQAVMMEVDAVADVDTKVSTLRACLANSPPTPISILVKSSE